MPPKDTEEVKESGAEERRDANGNVAAGSNAASGGLADLLADFGDDDDFNSLMNEMALPGGQL